MPDGSSFPFDSPSTARSSAQDLDGPSSDQSHPETPPLLNMITQAIGAVQSWSDGWGTYENHSSVGVDPEVAREALEAFTDRMKGNYPFGHPRYAGQMLKPPHPIAVAAYSAAMCINPNNHALDGGPPTSHMEKEVVADLGHMLGFPSDALGHLTAGGTIANLEALWVARESHPDRTIAISADAHYTHKRMCGVLDLEPVMIDTDAHGRLRLDALDAILAADTVGTIVVTAGTTGLGTVDPIAEVIARCQDADVRVHVDAAYGGFFRLLTDARTGPFERFPTNDFRAIEHADSVAIDPHKHGLQPYGCGAVLFRNPSVGRFYKHDSPYTYFTSDDLHLGEISLECSRAGAAAGALWTTLRALPLAPDHGIGAILAACLRASRTWADAIRDSDVLDLYAPPETDIVSYVPRPDEPTLSSLDAASRAVFDRAMHHDDEPVFLSLYRVSADRLTARFPHLTADCDDAAILRSVLMKPEHETYAEDLVHHLERIAREV